MRGRRYSLSRPPGIFLWQAVADMQIGHFGQETEIGECVTGVTASAETPNVRKLDLERRDRRLKGRLPIVQQALSTLQ